MIRWIPAIVIGVLIQLLVPLSVKAAPTANRVLFVGEARAGGGIASNQGEPAELLQLYLDLKEIYKNTDLPGADQAIHRVSASEIDKFSRRDLAQYDVVVWSYHGGTLRLETTERMLSLGLPIIVFDNAQFRLSYQLGLSHVVADRRRSGFISLRMSEFGNAAYHPLLSRSVYECISKTDNECPDYWESCVREQSPRWREYSSINVAWLLDSTRPLYIDDSRGIATAPEQEDAVVFVNDSKRVIVSGTHELPWPFLVRALDYAKASDPEENSLGGWMQPFGADQELLFSPSGDNVVQETDLDIESRGFNFKVTRTYRSGMKNTDSLLGRGWHLNHDRYLVYDTFSDAISILDEAGTFHELEQVQGPKYSPNDNADVRRTFVSVLGDVTDIATYYPPANRAVETKQSVALDGNCTGQIHPTEPGYDALHQEGFVVRDKSGNRALFARRSVENRVVETWCNTKRPCGFKQTGCREENQDRHDFRTRNGELLYYRLAYVEDRHGNRQQYFYEGDDRLGQSLDLSQVADVLPLPDRYLSCVVDTEGRGYAFVNKRKEYDYGVIILKHNAPVAGFRRIRVVLDSITSAHAPKVQYDVSFYIGGIAPENRPILGLVRSGPLETLYWYDGGMTAIERNGVAVRTFEYEPQSSSNGYFKAPQGRTPKLLTMTDANGLTTRFSYGVQRDNRPTPDELESPSGWVNIERNGVIDTIVYNARLQPIEYKRNYKSQRAGGVDQPFAACSAEDPIVCPGWSWRVSPSLDGNPLSVVAPSGIRTSYQRPVDQNLGIAQYKASLAKSSTDHETIYDWRRRLWQTHWIYRQSWDNVEQISRSTGKSCSSASSGGILVETTEHRYEPVFNQVVETWQSATGCNTVDTRLHRTYSYDYLEQGQALTADRFLDLTGLSYARDDVSLPSTWSVPIDTCPGGDQEWTSEVGNLACEGKPKTTAVGAARGRDAAFAVYQHDAHGRQIYVKDFSDYVTTQEYGCVARPEDDSFASCNHSRTDQHRAVLTSRWGREDLGQVVDAWYVYDPRGYNVRKVLYDGTGGDVVTTFQRNEYGWIQGLHTQASDGDSRHERYTHDDFGRATRVDTIAPESGGDGDTWNLAGTQLSHVMTYDDGGRKIWDCQEVGTDNWTCTLDIYNADNLLYMRVTYEQCTVANGPGQAEPSCSQYVKLLGYYYNGKLDVAKEVEASRESETRFRVLRYDTAGRLVAKSDPDSDGNGQPEWQLTEYDDMGRVLSRTDNGVRTTHRYNGFGQEVESTRSSLAPTTMGAGTVHAGGILLPGSVSSVGQLLSHSRFVYDERGTRVANVERQFVLGANESDGADRWSYMSYDQDDRELETVAILNGKRAVMTTALDNWGRPVRVVDGVAGTETLLERDHFGRVRTETTRSLSTTGVATHTLAHAYDYSVDDQVTRMAVAPPAKLHACLLGQLWNDAQCQLTISTYDSFGQLVMVEDASGQTTLYNRDGLGNLIRLTEENINADGEDIIVDVEYDGLGHVLARHDTKDTTTRYRYNGFGELIETVLPNGYTKTYTRNSDGAVTEVEHLKGHFQVSIKKVLDSYNRPLQVFVNGDLAQDFAYNANGQVVQARDYNLGIDPALVETSTVIVNRGWDSLGNLVKDEVDGRSVGADFVGSRLLGYTSHARVGMTLEYGHVVSVGGQTSYLGRPSRVTASGLNGRPALVADYDWIGSRLAQRSIPAPNGDLLQRQIYDVFGNLQGRRVTVGRELVSNFRYRYNANNRLVEEVSSPQNNYGSVRYDLDRLDRVVGYTDKNGSDEFDLDVANNITAQTSNRNGEEETATFDMSQDGLYSIESIERGEDQQELYRYDERGNLLLASQQQNGALLDERALTWDDQGRLVVMQRRLGPSINNNTEAIYKYDALGRRVGKTLGKRIAKLGRFQYTPIETVEMTYYGDDVVTELHQAQSTTGSTYFLAIHRDPTAVDSYLGIDLYTPNDSKWTLKGAYQLVSDVRNNVVGAVNQARTTVYKVEYDLHGQAQYCRAKQTVWICGPELYRPANNPLEMAAAFTYRFAGRRYDEESELYYYRTRYYAPEMGRFISLDTIGIWGDMNNYGNGYAYVGNMGNSLLDPGGQLSRDTRIEMRNALTGFIDSMGYDRQSIVTAPDMTDWRGVAGLALPVCRASAALAALQIAVEVSAKVGEAALNKGLREARESMVSQLVGYQALISEIDRSLASNKFSPKQKKTLREMRETAKKEAERLKAEIKKTEQPEKPAKPDGKKKTNETDDSKTDDEDKKDKKDGTGASHTVDEDRMDPYALREMLRSGRIKPKSKENKITPEYTSWESNMFWLRMMHADKEKSPIVVGDDGSISVNPNIHADRPNYEALLKFHNPGCVDPVPPSNLQTGF